METVTVRTACSFLRTPSGQNCSGIIPNYISSGNVDHLKFDTCNTGIGTVVTVGCLDSERVLSAQPYLLCQADGTWNTSLPTCNSNSSPKNTVPGSRPTGDLSFESLIIIGVVCGFAALVLLIIITLSLVYYFKVRKVISGNSSLDLPETDFYNTSPLGKHSSIARSNIYQVEINPMYSTRLWRRNYMDDVRTGYYPAYHEHDDVQERTDHAPDSRHTSRAPSRTEQGSRRYDTGPPPPYPDGDRVSTSSGEGPSGTQWLRPTGPPINTLIYNSIKWNPNNMKWHDNFNYLRDGRLPRYHMDETGLFKGNWPLF